jgi:hypothetical protein
MGRPPLSLPFGCFTPTARAATLARRSSLPSRSLRTGGRGTAVSAKQTGLVRELDLPHNEAWLLMAMADHADHSGRNVYPGVSLLAWKTGYTVR